MNGSSTFRSVAGARLRRWLLALAAALLLTADGVGALDPARSLAQYIRDDWSATKGYPGGAVYGFAQGADGYLWIAAEKGLVRFDGLRFQSMVPPRGPAGGGPAVLGIAATDDGAIWTQLRGPALMAYRDGAFAEVLPAHGFEGAAGAMTASLDGSILIASHNFGVLRYRHGRLVTVVQQTKMPRVTQSSIAMVTSVAETIHGIWIGTRDAGLFRFDGKTLERIGGPVPDVKVNCLLADRNGDVWVGTDLGVARATRTGIAAVALPGELGAVPVLALLRDRDANLWIAAGSHGVLRLNGAGVTRIDGWDTRSRGLVTALFEDRERNVWLGTTRGIERPRDGVFATYSGLRELRSDRIGPVHVDARGRAWFGPTERGLHWLDGDRIQTVKAAGLDDDVVYSLDGHGDSIWVGRQYGGLTHIRMTPAGLLATRYTERDGLAQDSVYVVHDPGDGSVWAGTLSGGASHFRNGSFETFTTSAGLVSNSVRAIDSHQGATWFGTPDGVSRRSGGQWRSYRVAHGLPSNDVIALLVDRDGHVWAGTSRGLAVLRAHAARFEPVPGVTETVVALTDDQDDALWCATADRLFRVSRQSLLKGESASLRDYDAADGLISREGVRRQRTLRTDASGRVWFATGGGLSVADPTRFSSHNLPAVLTIVGVSADETALGTVAPVAIPSRSRRVSIAFAAVSLAVPERVRYRYRLDGFDRDWSAPSTEHTAVYTNLRPGSYTFRIMASDSAGRWQGGEQTLAVQVLPAFWQTTPFVAGLVLGVASAVWIAYRFRLRQIERQLHLRFEERLGERTRIAQELHDTLLQGFLSASMHLHVATQGVPADSPARSKLAYVHGLMGKVIDEGRHAIRGLRVPDSSIGELETVLTLVAQELAVPDAPRIQVSVEGRSRALHPVIRDEISRIAREAIANAARHAQAHAIDVTVDYRADRLVVSVRDDGVGIDDQQVVRSGRQGHWGLAGMRERAAGIGASLSVSSRRGAGTGITLEVPNAVAFRDTPSSGRLRWIAWLRRLTHRA